MKVLDRLTGKLIDTKTVAYLDKVIELKNTRSPWETIDFIVQDWIDSNPAAYKSFVVDVEHTRQTRATKYGSNKSKTLRQTIDFPQPLNNRIRAVFKADELPFDKEFFDQFWRRYTTFRVAEQL